MSPLFMLDRAKSALSEWIFTNGSVFPLLSQTLCSLLREMPSFTGSLLLRLAAQDLFDSACFVPSRNHRRKALANFNFGIVSVPWGQVRPTTVRKWRYNFGALPVKVPACSRDMNVRNFTSCTARLGLAVWRMSSLKK